MLRGKTLEFLYHPALMSFVLWIILALILPFHFPKFRMKLISEETIPPRIYLYFSDLDNDGTSERISVDLQDSEQIKIIVRKNDRVLDQYNLPFSLANKNSVIFKDFNNDGFQEIIIFTLSRDAIYLNLIDPIETRNLLTYNRLIDNWARPAQSADRPEFNNIFISDEPKDSSSEITFFISTGFSLQPRNVYKYYYDTDSLVKSPESYATIIGCMDLRKQSDYLKETYLVSTQATGNIRDTVFYSDIYSWLMVLDENLMFRFDPVQIGEYPSKIQSIPIAIRGTVNYLVFFDYYGDEKIHPAFYIFDTHGNKIKEKVASTIEPEFSGVFANTEDGYESFYILKDQEATVDLIDTSLNVVRSYVIPKVASSKPLAYFDADIDGKKEYFFLGQDRNTLVICQHNFKHATQYPFEHDLTNTNFSQVFRIGSKPMLYIQVETMGWLTMFEKNWLYYLKIPYYLLLFGLLYLFLALIYRIQKKRIDLKTVTEKKLAALQIKAIKGQLDPHFTLNVLNAIGSLYATEGNRDKADYIFGKYARMIRQTVISSDEIIISLEEEIDFVRNYIEIERFRCNNSFEYLIDISPGISLSTKIPRMLIHTFVENSIKYGIKKRSGDGMLRVILRDTPMKIIITVEDNGPGFNQDVTSPEGTGKGLKLVNELSELYYQLEKVKITTTLENISNNNQAIDGTRAIIVLPGIQS